MTPFEPRWRHAILPGTLVLLALFAGPAAGQEADALCDPTQTTDDTCVIVGSWDVGTDTTLTFSRPNVRLRGTVHFTPHCVGNLTPCTADADCGGATCVRTGNIGVDLAGSLVIDRGAELSARGVAEPGDTLGPAGGTITLAARDIDVSGLVSVATTGRVDVPAGPAGEIVVRADGTVSVGSRGRFDASTSRGGCGGAIAIGTNTARPLTLTVEGLLTAEGATQGGSIELNANEASIAGSLQTSNTGHVRTRPPCDVRRGGGRIIVAGGAVTLTGTARARGREAAGGRVELRGADEVLVESTSTAAISVSGGAVDAFFAGGIVVLQATAGNVFVRKGSIDANGQSAGFGSDAGSFSIRADGVRSCEGTGATCEEDGDCGIGGVCTERGGDVEVEVALSAAGGAGQGSGCFQCDIRGTSNVAVSGSIDVGGGRQRSAVGGKIYMGAGGDLTLGPGAVKADAADGGAIILLAGDGVGIGRGRSGTLEVVNGTQLRSDASLADGFGGDIVLDGCSISIEPNARLSVDGGSRGTAGRLEATAREQLTVGDLAEFSALPDGTFALTSRLDPVIDPGASFEPPGSPPVADPSILACPICGNGPIVPPEECDGRGTCPVATQVCLPPGIPRECTCADTCGTLPGIQPGEDCDGTNLGGATCQTLGFLGGVLACDAGCGFDTSRCVGTACGDGVVGMGEACDPGGIGGAPPAFGGETCETRGFPDGGTLACTPDCSAIVTVPHCSATVETACENATDCPTGQTCVPGCRQCGNGVVDPGEECDDGTDNGSPNACRIDCTQPRCGDEILDFAHCSGNRTQPCEGPEDCPTGETCVRGEQCDQGTARCVGGDNDGAPCCTESDCPGGDCPSDDCGSNRDDVAGCCHCNCTLTGCQVNDDCNDHDFCTADTCTEQGCAHLINPTCCRLDVDGNQQADVATDMVYVARHLLALTPVPPSFRTSDPTIPPDPVIAERIDGVSGTFDVDERGGVDPATDVVYISRHLLALAPVPPTFRASDPTIPSDAVLMSRIDALCPAITAPQLASPGARPESK